MISKLAYFRFCQIIEAINRRLIREQKFKIKVKELTTKFLASIFIVGSFLSKQGKIDLVKQVDNFFLLKGEDKEKEKKLPPVSSFEKLMKYFGGKK